jgi:hypothetical protein
MWRSYHVVLKLTHFAYVSISSTGSTPRASAHVACYRIASVLPLRLPAEGIMFWDALGSPFHFGYDGRPLGGREIVIVAGEEVIRYLTNHGLGTGNH